MLAGRSFLLVFTQSYIHILNGKIHDVD